MRLIHKFSSISNIWKWSNNSRLLVSRHFSSNDDKTNNNLPLSVTESEQKQVEKAKFTKQIHIIKDGAFSETKVIDQSGNSVQDHVILGADGVPYDPTKDPYYSNEYMKYKYPQYFTKQIGFKRAMNVIKSDLAVLKHGRIHKTREELPSPNTVDICIFGGGIIGSAIAYFLKEKAPFGYKIAVIERDPTYIRSSTALSTGGLRQQFSLEENILMSLFSVDFIRNARKHLSILDGEPPDISFHPQGFLTLADESQAEQLIENHRLQIELGALVEIYSAERISEKFPMINTDGIVLGSYGVQNEGWFDPYALLVALKAKAQFFGAEFVHAEIIDFNFEYSLQTDESKCHYVVIREPDGNVKHIEFGIGIIATGCNSGQIAKLLGYGGEVNDWRSTVKFPIESRKRCVYSFNSPEGPGINFPFLIDNTGIYCRREGLGGHFICGRSHSIDNENVESSNLDVDYSYFEKEIYPYLRNRVPMLDRIKIRGGWAGYYDYNRIDQNPIIGQDLYYKNLVWCTGFGGNAVIMAPAIGRAIMEFVLDSKFLTIDLSRFGWERLINQQPLKEAYQF